MRSTFAATILCDSVSPAGIRLTSLEVTFPRIVLAEFNTHRVLSRNSASSRAIPVHKLLRKVVAEPFVPEEFGRNQPGMQAGRPLGGEELELAQQAWLRARDSAVSSAIGLISGGQLDGVPALDAIDEIARSPDAHQTRQGWPNVHKQLVNRILEPYLWHTVIVTATEWSNFLNLRTNPDSQPEIRRIAELMKAALDGGRPGEVRAGDWHLPLIHDDDRAELAADPEALRKVSAGRCARVSYLTHHGERDLEADVALCDRLLESGHMSPFEHVAEPLVQGRGSEMSGNFRGWRQYRKLIPGEADPLAGRAA